MKNAYQWEGRRQRKIVKNAYHGRVGDKERVNGVPRLSPLQGVRITKHLCSLLTILQSLRDNFSIILKLGIWLWRQ